MRNQIPGATATDRNDSQASQVANYWEGANCWEKGKPEALKQLPGRSLPYSRSFPIVVSVESSI